MNKKILAMLLVIVMIISVVPTMALADEHDCWGTNLQYNSNNNGTHNILCADGHTLTENAECVTENGQCICGYAAPAHDCWETNLQYNSNNNGTHNILCADGHVLTENAECVTENGKCICGYAAPAHDCWETNLQYNSNNNGTHNVLCADGHVLTENAVCITENGKCICGYAAPAHDCWETNLQYNSNNNGTHNVLCADGHVLTENAACVTENGQCICGYKKPTSDCDHMNAEFDYEEVTATTHAVICTKCDEVVTEETICVFTNGKCICGNTEPAAAPDCEHLKTYASYSSRGHHTWYCTECHEGRGEAECVDFNKDGKCDYCEHEMNNKEPDEHFRPTPGQHHKPMSDKYDRVPKTGDFFAFLWDLLF